MLPHEIDEMLSGLTPAPLSLCQQAIMDASTLLAPKQEGLFARFRTDAVGYAREVLKIKYLSKTQEELLRLLGSPHNDEWHGKVAVGAGVNFGKSYSGGIIVNWYFDCWGPCIVATTAPSQQSVVDLLWKEVRLLRSRADSRWGIGPQDFIGPQAPAMRRAPDWWAKGYVAAKGENFKGRHVENMCFLFDEAVGLSEMYFRMTKTMFKPNTTHLWICFYNPTNTGSAMYQEIIRPDSDWRVMELSNLEHPNVIAALRGEEMPIPAAVSLEQVEEAMKDDCEYIDAADRLATDIEWKPGSGIWLRPGQNFEGEHLGRWPSGDDTALWSNALWQAVSVPLRWEQTAISLEEIPRIGCDVARFGDDKTCTNVMWGDYSVFHESKGGQNTMRTCGRLIEIAEIWAEKCNKFRDKHDHEKITAKMIPIKIDDDGVGGGCSDRLREQGYLVWPIGAATRPMNGNRYSSKRSELWFMTRDRARIGKLKLGLLPQKTLIELRRQAMAPTWNLNSAGQREVERKDVTKIRLGRSPDDMDAMNLACYSIDYRAPEIIHLDNPTFQERMHDSREDRPTPNWRGRTSRRGLFGR